MNGIMSGIQDRQNYEVGGTARERLMKAFEEYPVQGVDPLSQFLIQGGLNLMSATPRGGVLATAAEAFKEPTAGLFKGLGTEQRAKREIALAGEQIDIEQEQAEKLARIKAKDKDVYAAQLYETQVEKMRDNLVDAAEARIISKFKGAKADDISRKTTDFVMQAPSNLKGNLIDIDYVDIGKKGVSQYVPDLSNVQVGQIFYDATLGQWKKRVGEGQGRLDFVTLDPYSGYKEIEIDQ
jgi:uncharacterized protein YcbK (DUF882 family)